MNELDFERLFALSKPYLEKNDLGSAHTSRVLNIARQNFNIPSNLQNPTVAGYAAKLGFDWNKTISLLYSKRAKKLAQEMLQKRRAEQIKPEN